MDVINEAGVGIFSSLMEVVKIFLFNSTLKFFKWIMGLINDISTEIWDNPVVIAILDFISIVGLVVFVISLIFLVADMGKNIDNINLKIIFINMIEAILYTFTIRWFGIMVFSSASMFIENTNFKIDLSKFDVMQNNSAIIEPFVETNGIAILIVLVTAIIFLVMNLRISAEMIVHIISSVLYIPFIVRGDTKKIGEWFQIAISISVTYIIQYISMYLSIYCLMLNDNLIISLIFITASLVCGKALRNFGYQNGAGSVFGSFGRMSSSVLQLIRLLH